MRRRQSASDAQAIPNHPIYAPSIEGGDTKALIEYMDSVGNSQAQIGHWLGYAAEMSALEDESLESVIETEAILARMQGRIK